MADIDEIRGTEDWRIYSDAYGDPTARRAAARRLAETMGSSLCQHFTIAALGACQQCERDNPDKVKIERLERENEELRLQIQRLQAEFGKHA